jgi:hypothetical protein
MTPQQIKNRRTILLLFAMSVIPFCIAWYLSENQDWLGGGTNMGQLITPPIMTESKNFSGYDGFSRQNISELKGHWVLVNVMPEADCGDACLKAIHKTRQIRLMMNKDLTRIRRMILLMAEVDQEKSATWWGDDSRLLRVKPTSDLVDKIIQLRNGDIPDGVLIVMDPLGNLMMQYDMGFDPYDVKKDLSKLLRISQIG